MRASGPGATKETVPLTHPRQTLNTTKLRGRLYVGPSTTGVLASLYVTNHNVPSGARLY